MVYSHDITVINKEAAKIASSMNSTQISSAHLIAAAMQLDYVCEAMDESGVDVERVKAAVNQECDGLAKISKKTADRYKQAGYDREVGLSLDGQSSMRRATKLAEDNRIWYTEYVEVSHLMMAVIGSGSCQALNEALACGPSTSSKIVNAFINSIAKHEAEERNLPAPELTFRLSRNEGNAQQQAPNQANAPKQNNKKKMKSEFCTDLLEQAKNDDKPFIGRAKEIDDLMQCLERRDKPNAILAGPPGVGKTDIVRGLAKRIVNDEVPEQLKGVNLLLVDVPGMLAGSEFRGSFEKKLKETIEEACTLDRPILFIDEIHTVLGAGKSMDSAMDAANILKPYLTDGKIRVVGATTDDEYRVHVEKDSAFMRRFQKIDVTEPTPAEAVEILNGVKPAYEAFHKVKVNKDAIKLAVDLSVRYMHDRFLPDKAIDILDQTCARVKIQQGKKITTSDIETTVSSLCHIPAHTVQKDEMAKVRTLDTQLKKQVFGQDEAIDKLTEAVQMSKAGLNDETKPIGTFLFVGPSGVGKTEVSKQLAQNLGIDFVRFDMSEYAEPHAIAKLIGSPAGYVGYDDGGILVEQIRKHPHSVVLFDEIEKAHPDIYKIFLQIFDYGMLTDNKGRKADFRNTIIIMTSNAGNAAAEKGSIGFGNMTIKSNRKDVSMKAIAEIMAPELRGRISATIVFNPLNTDVSKMIVNKELGKLTAKMKTLGIAVKYSDAAINKIVEMGTSSQYGAREIQKVIDQEIKRMFVKQIVSGKSKGTYTVDVEDGKFVANATKEKAEITI